MFLIESGWLALLITLLGTLFLFGELFVNMKGLFGLVGASLISFYFYGIGDTPTTQLLLMVVIYFVSLLLIIIDGKLLNDGTLTVIGGASMLLTIGISAPNWLIGLYAVLGVLFGAFLSLTFLKIFPKRKMWNKVTLVDQLTSESGYSTMNNSYRQLVGKIGYTTTDLRPVGTIRLNDQEYSAISNGHWIKKDTQIEVSHVDGTKIMVKKIES